MYHRNVGKKITSWTSVCIFLVALMAATIFLSGCAGNKVKPESKVVIQKVIEKKPLNLDHVEWVIVTRENVDEVWAQIEGDNEGVALFALRHGDYERLAMNIAEIRKLIGEYVIILKQYKEYYEEK